MPLNQNLRLGNTGPAVAEFHKLLLALSKVHLEAKPSTPFLLSLFQKETKLQRFGRATRDIVRAFQRSKELPLSGELDKETRTVIFGLLNDTMKLSSAILGGGVRTNVEAIEKTERTRFDAILNERLAAQLSSVVVHLKKKLKVSVDADFEARIIEEINGAKLDYSKCRDLTLGEVIASALEKVQSGGLTTESEEEFRAALRDERIATRTICEELQLSVPIGRHPFLGEALRAARTEEIGRAAGLEASKIGALVDRGFDLEHTSAFELERVVKEQILSKPEALQTGFAGAVGRISGTNCSLIKTLLGKGYLKLDDFLSWEVEQWHALIIENLVDVPAEEGSSFAYAETLRRSIETSYPSPYFIGRVNRLPGMDVFEAAKDVLNRVRYKSLCQKEGHFAEYHLDTDDLSPSAKESLETKVGHANQLLKRFAALGAREILLNADLTTSEKIAQVQSRIESLQSFSSRNSGLDLYLADFIDKNARYDWTGVKPGHQGAVRSQMRAMQRLLWLTRSPTNSLTLLDRGYSCASSIASKPLARFGEESGLDHFVAEELYARSQEKLGSVSQMLEGFRDGKQLLNDNIRSPEGSVNLMNVLREIDGYEALFGPQSFCACDHCRSILSISAYFTDLMRFISENISEVVFETENTDHPLHLRRRRPDLWSLDLGCRNAKMELPYLEIVNEVLCTYIESDPEISNASTQLTKAQNSIDLPIDLNLFEARLYADELGISLAKIHGLAGGTDAERRRETLGLSPNELKAISEPKPESVWRRFGDHETNDMKLQEFMAFTLLTRKEVTQLLAARCYPEFSTISVTFDDNTDVALGNVEKIEGLTKGRLDIIHRFLRLTRALGTTIPETDTLMCSVKQSVPVVSSGPPEGSGTTPDALGNILELAPLAQLKAKLELNWEEAAAMIGRLPAVAVEEGQPALVDRVFDRKAIFGVAEFASSGEAVFRRTATLHADRSKDTLSAQISSGLSLEEAELSSLFKLLGHDVERDIEINEAVLACLYRLSRIIHRYSLSVPEFVDLCRVSLDGSAPSNIEKLLQVAELAEWIETVGSNPADLAIVLFPDDDCSASEEATRDLAAKIILRIQSSEATYEERKRALLLGLAAHFDLTSTEMREAYLGKLTTFELEDDEIEKALNAKFVKDSPNQLQNPEDLDGLVSLMLQIERLKPLRQVARMFSVSDRAFLELANEPKTFGVQVPAKLTLKDVRALADYAALVRRAQNRETGPSRRAGRSSTQEVDLEGGLIQCMRTYADKKFDHAGVDYLAALFGTTAELVRSVQNALTLPETPMNAVAVLQEAVRLANELSIDGASLKKIGSTDPSDFTTAASILRGVCQSRYRNSPKGEEKLAELREKINERRRDALCSYIMGDRERFRFKDRGDLYAFFLLDPEMGGCFTTTRVIAAVSSLQTYVARCLNNLEQTDPNLAPGVANLNVSPGLIPTDEWAWRKNYRVWEANRKVFVYPESYIDPTLRDDKSHLFKRLEEELLQQEVTLETAEKAYRRYVTGFTEIAQLRYAGALAVGPLPNVNTYSETELERDPTFDDPRGTPPISMQTNMRNEVRINIGNRYFEASELDTARVEEPPASVSPSTATDKNVYFLFARTNQTPYRYFFREYKRCDDVWGNWRPIDVAIEAARVSAVELNGRLYVFWNDVKHKELNKIKGGTSSYGWVQFDVKTKFTTLNADGTWTPVQTMPFGSMTFRRDLVFFRALGSKARDYLISENEGDDVKDAAYAAFASKALSKPYVAQNYVPCEPLQIHYMWSHGEGIEFFDYKTGPITEILLPYPVVGKCDGVEFRVSNSLFGEKKNYVFEIWDGEILLDDNIEAIAQIVNEELCIIELFGEFTLNLYGVNIPIRLDGYMLDLRLNVSPSPSAVQTSRTGMSISRNSLTDYCIEEITERDSYLPIESRKFLRREYELSDGSLSIFNISDGQTSFYVENGANTFTEIRRVVSQQTGGEAYLNLPSTAPTIQSIRGVDVPLSTVLTEELADTLFADGLETFLELSTQQMSDYNGSKLDFSGPYGKYYWELFFHIPFLIGWYCNATQKFKEARWWYERIFNPTWPGDGEAAERCWRFREFRDANIPSLNEILLDESAIETYKNDPFDPYAVAVHRRSAYMKAVVMAYVDNLIDWADSLFARGTRESNTEALVYYQLARDVLGDRPKETGECQTAEPLAYKDIAAAGDEGSEFVALLENILINKSNVHELTVKPLQHQAMLRRLISGFQTNRQTVSFKVITERFRGRTINDKIKEVERRLAQDDRSKVRLDSGEEMTAKEAVDSGKLNLTPRYGMPIEPWVEPYQPMATYAEVRRSKFDGVDVLAKQLELSREALARVVRRKPVARRPELAHINQIFATVEAPISPGIGIRSPATSPEAVEPESGSRPPATQPVPEEPSGEAIGTHPGLEVKHERVPVFCVPMNERLLDNWDRVDRQLFKIRHCQDIHGRRRRLALIEPPIDPMMLVRARAAGLDLDDIAAFVAEEARTPPYRFRVALQLARQAAQTVRDFGQALLSAMEKKGSEELQLLQLTHERDIQRMTRNAKQRSVREAEKGYESAQVALARTERRLEQLDELISSGNNKWEDLEAVTTHIVSVDKATESALHLATGLTYLLVQIGSPFALTFGGKQLGDSGAEIARAYNAAIDSLGAIAASARIEGGRKRRDEGWEHERELVRKDLEDQKARGVAAEIRLELARMDERIHDRQMELTKKREEFYRDKDSNLGLYTYLSATLNRLHRSAYAVAYDVAREAQRSYKFETGENDEHIAPDNWDPLHAGLLAGERLKLQLDGLERAYLKVDVHVRHEEIRHAFSLAQLNGKALLDLRQKGTCTFKIPEIAFEMAYPGQYRRLIKRVRITIPSVVGPYTNIGARLTLNQSWIAQEDGDSPELDPNDVGKNYSISLSRATDDSGRFEPLLDGDRYLPFEGAGAISEWTLELPKALPSFDYHSISDVIIELEYTARQGDAKTAEKKVMELLKAAASDGLHRLISLKHDFPDTWARLRGAKPQSPEDVTFSLTGSQFPYALKDHELELNADSQVRLYLRPENGAFVDPTSISLTLEGEAVEWAEIEDISFLDFPTNEDGQPASALAGKINKLKGGTAAVTGAVKRTWSFKENAGALYGLDLTDLFILMQYKVAEE